MTDMRKLRPFLIVSPVVLSVAIFWVVVAIETRKRDYSSCNRAVASLATGQTRVETLQTLSHQRLVTNNTHTVVAICCPDAPRSLLPVYPVKALETEVVFDENERIKTVRSNDVVVWRR